MSDNSVQTSTAYSIIRCDVNGNEQFKVAIIFILAKIYWQKIEINLNRWVEKNLSPNLHDFGVHVIVHIVCIFAI